MSQKNDAPKQAETSRDAARSRGDPVAELILSLVAALPPGKSLTPEAVARAVVESRGTADAPPNAWRRYLEPVKQQALNLARQGKIAILRKGKPVDPKAPVKGVIRLAAARDWSNA